MILQVGLIVNYFWPYIIFDYWHNLVSFHSEKYGFTIIEKLMDCFICDDFIIKLTGWWFYQNGNECILYTITNTNCI